MPGELIDIGERPRLVAEFLPPRAQERFALWRQKNAAVLDTVPKAAWRVEYGRTGAGLYVRVRIDEAHVPDGLVPPEDDPGATAGLPPLPA